jgi:nuclear cap-binding protein subunit 1
VEANRKLSISVQLLDTVLACLRSLDSSSFADTMTNFPQPYAQYPDLDTVPFELPSVLVPPEVIEMDGLSDESGEDAQVKKEEWPEYILRLFDNDVSSHSLFLFFAHLKKGHP